MKSFIPLLGTTIVQACQSALEDAKSSNSSVRFVFNDISMLVKPKDTLDGLLDRWNTRKSNRKAKYDRKHKDQIVKENEEEKNRIIEKQSVVDSLISSLSGLLFLGEQIPIINWIRDFTEAADHIGVIFDKQHLINSFESSGFKRNAFVGSDYRSDQESCFRYIIGQVLDCLYIGMPPPPVAICFCELWLKGDYGSRQ